MNGTDGLSARARQAVPSHSTASTASTASTTQYVLLVVHDDDFLRVLLRIRKDTFLQLFRCSNNTHVVHVVLHIVHVAAVHVAVHIVAVHIVAVHIAVASQRTVAAVNWD